jgi:hypothetical protein
MEATIAKLEYTLKDQDIQGEPVIIRMIEDVMVALQKVMVVKRHRWAEEEKEMGDCPCGCSKN